MTKQITTIDTLLRRADVQNRLMQAFGNKEEANLFILSLMQTVNNNALIQKCKPEDIVKEALRAAAHRLPISNELGTAYLVPFNSKNGYKPQMIIGYKGLIQLALRTNQYKTIHADIIYQGEKVKRDKITGEIKIEGEPTEYTAIGYVAHIELKNGFQKTIYMTKAEIIAHAKKYSKAYNSSASPWKTAFDEMALKTVLRKILSTYGLKSIIALMEDNETEAPEHAEPVDAEIVENTQNEDNAESKQEEQEEDTDEIPF